jgi:hypothetical protein
MVWTRFIWLRTGSYEHCNELPVSMKSGKSFLIKESSPRSYTTWVQHCAKAQVWVALNTFLHVTWNLPRLGADAGYT